MNIKRCGTCGMTTNDACGNPQCDISTTAFDVPVFAQLERRQAVMDITKKVMAEQAPILEKLAEYEKSEYMTMADKITQHSDPVLARREEVITSKGTKYDNGKADLTLIPMEAMEAMARAFMHGEKKYTRGNFKNGLETTRTLAAALRHIYEKLDRVDIDHESGVDTLGHAMAAIAMTIYNLKHHPEMDNRDKKGEKK